MSWWDEWTKKILYMCVCVCVCIVLHVSHSVVFDALWLMNCSLPDSSVHGILQARILEWVAISFSRESSRPTDWTWVSCIAGRFFTSWVTREAHIKFSHKKKEILPFATTCMDLDDIVLSKISQTLKDHLISLICGILKEHTIKTHQIKSQGPHKKCS